MASIHPRPLTPRTPTDLFAALALSPSLATPYPSSIPTLHISPPSPTSPPSPLTPVFRPLTRAEAHQLTLLLHQYLHPHRVSPKGLMRESIRLAEEFHTAGVRWDKRRRVMGLHVRGTWEEAERLGAVGGSEGEGAAERYVQGSFLSIAESPHPLDPMPIPIDLPHPHSCPTTLPKLTLQTGLAQTLGAGMGVTTTWQTQAVQMGRGVEMDVDVPPTGSLSAFPLTAGFGLKRDGGKVGWRGKKKAGLRVKTGIPFNTQSRIPQLPNTALSATIPLGHLATGGSLTARFMRKFIPGLTRGKTKRNKGLSLAGMLGVRQRKYALVSGTRSMGVSDKDSGQVVSCLSREEAVVRTARKVSMGGWEVR